MLYLICAALGALLLARPALAVSRLISMGPAARRNWHRAMWARWRWAWLTRNLQLAYLDKHHKRQLRPRLPLTTAVRVDPDPVHLMRWPRASFRADAYGWTANVRTIPRVGRAELEANAEHIANAWGVARVQVAQRKPGRVLVRGLRTDPLLQPLPELTWEQLTGWRVYVGRDEWNADRHLDLAGITGVTIGGLPRYGKTSLMLSWLGQLAASGCVQFVFIDGKGGGDYIDWESRAALILGDGLADAAAALEGVHELMRLRLAAVATARPRNRWHTGPTRDWPLIVTVVDECHGFFDTEAVKGDKQAEQLVRTCRTMAAQLVKRGGSVLFLTIFLTQKQTADAIPTAIRDNCTVGVSFATRTTEAAVAGLGEGIRQYPTSSPVTLQARPDYVGVCTASLPTGQQPFVRLRVPEVTEAAAADRAAATAQLRADPFTDKPALTPAAPLQLLRPPA